VTKVPRFTFEKFPQADDRLTTQMKSVGEAMAIGRTFQESLQKALRSLEIGVDGLVEKLDSSAEDAGDILARELRHPGPSRIFYLADAFRAGWSLDEVYAHSSIDPWFLAQIEDLVREEKDLAARTLATLRAEEMFALKRKGFSDSRLASILGSQETEVRAARHKLGIRPVYKRIDSCAAEFATSTAYLYSTYEEECEAAPTDREKVIVLGGGPNRIGQGIEFDYCCVHAAMALREDGYETIMINCNPETVSTDFDTSDRLYFEPLTLEDVLEIIHLEKPFGVIVQYGGQTPLKLARALEAADTPIIGTTPDSIDLAEDRERFQKLVDRLGLKQPPNRTARSLDEAVRCANEIGYPLVVRPSYVLGGRAMEIVFNDEDLKRYMREAVSVSNESPVLLDRFLDDAIEMDVDAVCDGQRVVIGGLMQHIEQAGVHSGDSACSIPPYDLARDIQNRVREQVRLLAESLGVVGLMNTQFAIQGEEIFILEVNPRASRTVPFVSKATGHPLAKIAARCMVGKTLEEQGVTEELIPSYYSVKEAVFPFIKFPGVDPLLGPEMKSTGEVMGVGATFGEAYAKAQRAASVKLARSGNVLISVREGDRQKAIPVARNLLAHGFQLVATRGTARVLQEAGLPCTVVNKVYEGRPHIVDMIKNGELQFIVNTTEGKKAIADSFTIRRQALQQQVTYTTTISGAQATCYALSELDAGDVNCLQDLHRSLKDC
jgi:carbamoyl-phosphate synthase large subunit